MATLKGPLGLIVAFVVAFVFFSYFGGLAGIGLWIGILGALMVFKGYTSMADSLPFFKKEIARTVGPVLVIATVLMYGFFGFPTLIPTWDAIFTMITGGDLAATIISQPITTGAAAAGVSECAAMISPELADEAVDVTFNAYDEEADAGSATVVDLTTNCWFYTDGNADENFVALSSDTSAKTESTYWSIGDTLYTYCGGSSYYTEPIQGLCLDSKTMPVVLKSHAITTAATGVDMVVKDDSANTLTAAGNTSTADYDITLGANEEAEIIVEVKQAVADKSFNLGAFATATFNDLKSIKPVAGQGLTAVVAPDFMEDIAVSDAESVVLGNVTNVDYKIYVLDTPVLLTEWKKATYRFTVLAGATDPSATDNVFSTIDGGIICSLDATYSKGSDGTMYLDYHNHQVGSEANVGYVEDFAFPVGGYECSVLEGN